jgi:hypothetical protein
VSVNRAVAVSWLRKYWLIGALVGGDRKYLLKEILFVAAYAACCLQINHIVLWPASFALFLLPLHILLLDLLPHKIHTPKVAQIRNPDSQQPNAIRNQGESEIEIESVNIDAIPAVSSEPLREELQVKREEKEDRSGF